MQVQFWDLYGYGRTENIKRSKREGIWMNKDMEIKLNTMEKQVKEMEAIVEKMETKRIELDTQMGVLDTLKNLLH